MSASPSPTANDTARQAVFREATAADLPAIVAMLADDVLGAGRETPADPPDPAYVAAFEAIAANPHDHLVVAEVAGTVQACAQLTILHGLGHTGMRRAQIEDVRVAAPLRGGGLGAALVDHLVSMARDAGCGVVQLASTRTRVRAIAFYERLGFEATHVGLKLDLGAADPPSADPSSGRN